MKIGDKITLKDGFSYYSPTDFVIHRHVERTDGPLECEIVQVLDETYNLYLVKRPDGKVLQIQYKE